MSIDKTADFDYLLFYAAGACLDEDICRDRLRMLWVAFCLHQNLDVDTLQYDEYALQLWEKIQETGDGASEWEDYNGFSNVLARYLC